MQRRCNRRNQALYWAQGLLLLAMLGGCAGAAIAQTLVVPVHKDAVAANTRPLTGPQQAEFARAQSAARKILARAEFQRPEPTWWDRFKAKINEILVRFFLGVDRMTTQSPWVGRVLEWLLFVVAAVGVLVWVLRTVQRQRLRVALGGQAAQAMSRNRETENWRELAELEASKGAWREAIHALYWAAIVHLEQRRAWRHNESRTPREYVRLLKTGSEEQRELRTLTNSLEESWYGHREPNEREFGAARESFDRLMANSPQHGAPAGGQA
ncbi:MAG TPA: DUF4129 domain-containing protein [Acidobacteriaceae bacterium]|nr:DUF4129 domain-containing protein [Acidobacteriaceae bacterium]